MPKRIRTQAELTGMIHGVVKVFNPAFVPPTQVPVPVPDFTPPRLRTVPDITKPKVDITAPDSYKTNQPPPAK